MGIGVIYAAENISLAALEVLVNAPRLPLDYTLTEIHIPQQVSIEYVSASELPEDWDRPTDYSQTQNFGAQWAAELRSTVLSVPSCVIPRERNLVINPAHPCFEAIEFLPRTAFTFDPRLA